MWTKDNTRGTMLDRNEQWQEYRQSLQMLANAHQESRIALKRILWILRINHTSEDDIITRLQHDLQPVVGHKLTRRYIRQMMKEV